MGLIVLAYVLVTIVVAFKLLMTSLAGAALLLLCSALGFVAGSGTRGAFYLGQRKSGVVIGVGLLLAGLAIGFYSKITVGIMGLTVTADTWAGLGALIGFFAAKPKDVLPREA